MKRRSQLDRCKHFTGISNDADGNSVLGNRIGPALDGVHRGQCRAGVFYNDVCGLSGGHGIRLPCFFEDGLECGKCERKTAEELAAEEAEITAMFDRQMKVSPLIAKVKKEHRGQSWNGVEKCPVCGGSLHLSHAAINGHVWGKCETDGCLSWME